MPSASSASEEIPALLVGARGGYGNTIGALLAAAGFADLPRNGPFVLRRVANQAGSPAEVMRDLGVSRQAASQLIDTLVLRGYLTREINPGDRRRLSLELTAHGRAAAETIRTGIERVDAALAQLISPSELAGLRAGLAALREIRNRTERG